MSAEPVSPAIARAADRLADGEWHRLHPATPLLRGGFVFVAILAFVVSQLRERIVDLFLGAPDVPGDPISVLINRGLVVWALLAVALVLLVCIVLFYVSWRMHTFRISEDAVEVRHGVLFRTSRNARLDRIQAIHVNRPLIARIFGASKLDINVAGHDANVQLAYLSAGLAVGLRRDILQRASGAKAQEEAIAAGVIAPGEHGSRAAAAISAFVDERMRELAAEERELRETPPESVVRIPPARLLGSIVLSGFTVFLAVLVAAIIVGAVNGHPWILLVILPGLLGSGSFFINRFTKSLRYSIAGTPDGVRIGFGLLSTSSETLPPGRIHAVEIMQPLLWRPFGWWQIRIDTAGHSRERGAAGQANTTILPVGDSADVARVLGLVLPEFANPFHAERVQAAMVSRGGDRFVASPHRAIWIRPLSWRRTGSLLAGSVALLRTGFIWRKLVVLPLARLQSIELYQGPIGHALGLVEARFHTVAGPVHPRLPAIDRELAVVLFEEIASGAIRLARTDRSHRWNEVIWPDEPVDAGLAGSGTGPGSGSGSGPQPGVAT